MAEFVTVEFKRNGDARDVFLRELVADIKRLAAAHNAKFDAKHGTAAL